MTDFILLAPAATGIGIFRPLYRLFGVCMEFLMSLVGNQYFIAIILFTLATRLILLPINIHQQKTASKSARLQPKIQKIQKKYNIQGISDPRERQKAQMKLNDEMQALYAREGHNPMQLGCGPMLFQMVFLMGIVGIIYYPLSYVIGINKFGDFSADILNVVQNTIGDKTAYLQLAILENWDSLKEVLAAKFSELFTPENCSAIEAYRAGLCLGKLDMTAIPHWKDGIIVLIPIFSFLTSLFSSFISNLIQKKNNPAMAQQMKQMNIMMYIMPLFSFYIAFKVPAAVGFYWIVSNLIMVIQQLFIAKVFSPKKSQAKLMLENTIYRRSREENIKKIKN